MFGPVLRIRIRDPILPRPLDPDPGPRMENNPDPETILKTSQTL